MAKAAERKRVSVGMILQVLLATLSAVGLVGGGTLYGAAIQTWAEYGHVFSGFARIDWLIGVIGAATISAALMLAGAVLRLMAWRKAPLASLALAIASVVFLLVTYAIFSRTSHGEDSIEVILLSGLCIAGLLAVPLPPFMHWLRARQRIAPADDVVNRSKGSRP